MGRFKSVKTLKGSGSLSLPSTTTISVVGGTGPGSGACFHLPGDLAVDCGANPNTGTLADLHLERVVGYSVDFPIRDLLVSHFHYDHYGALLAILKAYLERCIPLPRILCTNVTWDLLKPRLVEERFLPDGPKENPRSVYHAVRTKNVTPVKNEHSTPGSEGFHVKLPNGKTIFYTGDFRKFPRLPEGVCRPDLCILDCTGAQKMEPTAGREKLIRENIMALAMEALASPSASVYVSTFSTQLERICWLEKVLERKTGYWPSLAGTSFFANVGAYRLPLRGWWNRRFVICSGVWAQPGSKLVQMSKGRDMDYRLKRGDRVVLSGSMPTWNLEPMADIAAMCQRLIVLGVEVIVDSSVETQYLPGLRRVEVHCSGHASFPEIVAFLKQLKPKSVFATHGSAEARGVIEDYCRNKGINVISMNSSSEIILT